MLRHYDDRVAWEDEAALMEAWQMKKGSVTPQLLTRGTRRLSRIGNEKRPSRNMGTEAVLDGASVTTGRHGLRNSDRAS